MPRPKDHDVTACYGSTQVVFENTHIYSALSVYKTHTLLSECYVCEIVGFAVLTGLTVPEVCSLQKSDKKGVD